MNFEDNLILAKGKDITASISSCVYSPQTNKYEVVFESGETYSYNWNSILWIKKTGSIDPAMVRVNYRNKPLKNIKQISVFAGPDTKYFRINLGYISTTYKEQDLEFEYSCKDEPTARNVFAYLKRLASVNELLNDSGEITLAKTYNKIDFIDTRSALAAYINPAYYNNAPRQPGTLIFPFGCNASQFQAVSNAIRGQFSVIQGPPGTGKTQTILNIIANLLVQGKTAQLVSNNNSATANVFEKLSSPKYSLGFLVAALGSSNNKAEFIKNQSDTYPKIDDWKIEERARQNLLIRVNQLSNELSYIFKDQERSALLSQQLQEIELEAKYFREYCAETGQAVSETVLKKNVGSARLVEIWNTCQSYSDSEKSLSTWFKLKTTLFDQVFYLSFFRKKPNAATVITHLQEFYYRTKTAEIKSELDFIKRRLDAADAKNKMNELTVLSMGYLRATLYLKYGGRKKRRQFDEKSFWENPQELVNEYPIVLSSTFSSYSSLAGKVTYDYVIMDEASQVDINTGALALVSAKNTVIVGDVQQLPNVVTKEMKEITDKIFDTYNLPDSYNYSKYSFLGSVCAVLPQVPQTLLKEHYRCHPKIIGFCNRKFYNNSLVVMTEDKGETDTIVLYKTAKGNHKRGNINQRQIDVVREEVLPSITSLPDTGIIAPYKKQVSELTKQVPAEIDISTVHGFQGREKNTIIITLVDDVYTSFSDDPNIINVAVSRAKNQLCLVVSGNDQPAGSVIGDLISYIEYNRFEVRDSKIYSVFDYLYSQYTEKRLAFLQGKKRISEYDSENLMYAVITDVLAQNPQWPLQVACHFPLHRMIRNFEHLDSREEYEYATNPSTHFDFLIYSTINKAPIMAIEVDGHSFHQADSEQGKRDLMKNQICEKYGLKLLRLPTTGFAEKEKIEQALKAIYQTAQ